MATEITQIDDGRRGKIILRVKGEMQFEDAVLLEKIALEMQRTSGGQIVLDLADLDFLDSESAPVLLKLHTEKKIEIQGMEIFLQSIINQTERRN